MNYKISLSRGPKAVIVNRKKRVMKSTREPITLNELKSGTHVIRSNTISVENKDGTFDIFLYGNLICRMYFDGTVRLFDGGHRTATTKNRLNAILKGVNLISYVFQVEKQWFIKLPDFKVISFVDGVIIDT